MIYDLLLFIQPETAYGIGVFVVSAIAGAITERFKKKNDGL